MTRLPCESCRFFQPTRMQDSGIKAVDGVGNWFYQMGNCGLALDNAPIASSRFGKYPGIGSPEYPETPSWASCWYGKRGNSRVAAGHIADS